MTGLAAGGATVLGRTGLTVSRIGLGLAALGRPGYINLGHGEDLEGSRDVADLEARCHAVLDLAWSAGVRYVDAARSYGRAEAYLASWLDGRDVDPVVGSKWGYTYTAGWSVDADEHEVKDHGLATLDRQRHETAALLGDRLDLYQIHSATLDTGVLDDEAVLGRLAELGVPVGLSVSGPGQAATIRRALEVGADLFATVQATWNPLEPSAGPALAEAHDAGWGVIVKEAVANGRLTDRGDPPGALVDVAAAAGIGVDAVAIAAALSQPFVDVVLSGAATTAQLRSNLDAVVVDPGALAELDLPGLAEQSQAYWARRGDLAWT